MPSPETAWNSFREGCQETVRPFCAVSRIGGLSEFYCVPFNSEVVGELVERLVWGRAGAPVGFFGGMLVLTVGVFCPSVSLIFFDVMKGKDKNRHKNRKIPAFHLVSLVSTLPAPAPKSASVAPPPKAVPNPASFLGSCTSTSRTRKRQLRNSTTIKNGLRKSNRETSLFRRSISFV